MHAIVVGIDESAGSQQALEWARDEAVIRQAPLRLVHVRPTLESSYPYGLVDSEGLELDRGRMERTARELLESALAKAGGEPSGVSVELAARFGSPARVLVEESDDAALVVVGSRGRGGFGGLLLGSVSQQVVHHARCPVVVIPAGR